MTVTDPDTGVIWICHLTGGHTHDPSLRDQIIYIHNNYHSLYVAYIKLVDIFQSKTKYIKPHLDSRELSFLVEI